MESPTTFLRTTLALSGEAKRGKHSNFDSKTLQTDIVCKAQTFLHPYKRPEKTPVNRSKGVSVETS
jgi:hypothetical protein